MLKSLNKKILRILMLWVVVFGVIEVFFVEVITVHNHVIAIPYFATISLIIVAIYQDLFKKLIRDTKKNQYSLLVISLLLHVIIYWFAVSYLGQPTALIENNSISFLLLNKFFLFGKPFGILFQQLLIVVLVSKLHQNRVSLKSIILFTALFFGIAHAFMVKNSSFGIALYFIVFAISASAIFPYQILRVKNGYLYNFMLHMAFYDLSALLFWTLY